MFFRPKNGKLQPIVAHIALSARPSSRRVTAVNKDGLRQRWPAGRKLTWQNNQQDTLDVLS